MFVQDRDSARRFFLETWQKYRQSRPLEPLEEIVAAVILAHPEYHGLLEDEEEALSSEYTVAAARTNPFLHMGMHVALREQLSADRPQGIAAFYNARLKRFNDPHALEHRMMECLGEVLWRAQRDNLLPDEAAYLDCLGKIS
jgi:hypothetical protein